MPIDRLLDLDSDDDDEDLVELAGLRDDLHQVYARRDRDRAESVFVRAVGVVARHPRLRDDDRKRLLGGLEREYRARTGGGLNATPAPPAPWRAFVANLPPPTAVRQLSKDALVIAGHRIDLSPLSSSKPPDPETVGDAVVPPPVHWNTHLRDGAVAVGARPLEVDHTYTVETRLAPAPAPDAAASSLLAAGTVEDGTPVRFIIECALPVLQAADGAGGWTTRVEGEQPYRLATGDTEPVLASLRPTSPGPVALTVSLCTANALRASTTIVQFAATAAMTSVATPLASAPAPEPIAAAVLAGAPADLRLELVHGRELRASTATILGKPCELARGPAELVKLVADASKELSRLSRSYQPDPSRGPFGMKDGEAAFATLAGIGAQLHDACFGHPDEVGDANLKELARLVGASPATGKVARLQIGGAFQPFPWAIFHDGAWRGRPLDGGAALDRSDFWGQRFRIDRAIVGHLGAAREPVWRGSVRVQPCINPHLDAQQGVTVVAGQQRLFAGLAGVTAGASVGDEAALEAFLGQPGGCDLLYFFCHAHAAKDLTALLTFTTTPADEQAKLVLGAAGGITVERMRKVRPRPLADHPLVVLNACGSAGGDPAFASPLLLQFLDRWRASGVLGTDWEIPTVFADAFARRLVELFLGERRPLGEALATVRDEAFAADNPFPLLYALYGSPDLTFIPGASS